jgi:glycosyltransferase involved in cell wall biosynthesis
MPKKSNGFFRLVTGGHGNPHTRLEEFLRGWSAISSPHRYRLKIFGRVANLKKIQSLAKELGLDRYIEVTGFVSSDQLNAILDEAHLAINLRNPTLGEASGGQLRYWNHCLPTLVSNAGWYAECPDNTVCKISTANEEADIKRTLENLLNSPDEFRQIGANGKDYLMAEHNLTQYADALIKFVDELANKLADLCTDKETVNLFKPAVKKLLNNSPYSCD